MAKKLLEPALLRKLLSADFETGKLTWKKRDASLFPSGSACRSWNRKWAGKPAFTSITSFGYFQGSVLNIKFTGHSVIWAMFHNKWPQYQIDHINGVRTNNGISNLRDVPQSVNVKNSKLSKRNSSGICGVMWDASRSKWMAYGSSDGLRKTIGRYDCIGKAMLARQDFNGGNGFSNRHGVRNPFPL